MIRLIRLVRLIRIVKLFKYASKKDTEEEKAKAGLEPSRVGKILQDKTQKKVILLVLVCVLVLPYMEAQPGGNLDEYQQFGFRELHRLPQDCTLNPGVSGVSCGKARCVRVVYMCRAL